MIRFASTFATVLLSGAAVAPLTLAAGAAAQDAAEDGAGRESIVVTARRREETLQDVPIAVTAFSGEQLETSGAADITVLGQSTPNVTLEVSRGTNTTLTAFIRGVGQQDPVAGFEQGVGLYLDDIYLNRPQAAVLDIYDVERVEILRGPQGTLYGRNTIGGAVKYVTRRLDPDNPELSLKASFGTFNQTDYVVKGSTPISENFRVGAAVASLRRDGFGENLFTGQDNYNKDVLAVRASAEADLADNFQVRFSADYTQDDSNPRQGFRPLPSSVRGAQPLGDIFDTEAGITEVGPLGENEVIAQGAGLIADWQVSDRLSFKSITGYREDRTETPIDFDSGPLNTFDVPAIYDNEQFSQEFQAIYNADRWSAVGGVYYLDASAFNVFDVTLTSVASFTLGDVQTEAWAVFGEATYDLTDTVSLTLGGRYTNDRRSSNVTRELFLGTSSPAFGGTGPSLTVPVIVDGEEVVPDFESSRTDDRFTPRIILDWAASEDLNLYASYSEGFKGGGFDPRGNFANPDVREGFEPEIVKSYEVGAKGSFVDGRLVTNTAVFFADYTDVQIPGSVIVNNPDGSTDFQGTVTNAGAAEFYGVEFEGTAFITDTLSLLGSFGYIDAEYTEFVVSGVDVSDDRAVQNTPEWTASGSVNWTTPFPIFENDGEMTFLGTASYRGDTQQFETSIPLLDQEAFWLFDASMVWNHASGRFSAAVHGKNLLDEEYITSGYNFPTVDNSILQFYGNPRTVTATFNVRY